MEFVAIRWCTGKYLRLDRTVRDFACDNIEVSLVVIRLGVTGPKKTDFSCPELGERGKKRWRNLLFVERPKVIALMVVLLTSVVSFQMLSMVLVLWGVGLILGNGHWI